MKRTKTDLINVTSSPSEPRYRDVTLNIDGTITRGLTPEELLASMWDDLDAMAEIMVKVFADEDTDNAALGEIVRAILRAAQLIKAVKIVRVQK